MVIGKTGCDIPQSKSLDYVAGCCPDITVRGAKIEGSQIHRLLGAWTLDGDGRRADPDAVPISLEVNGEVRHSELIYNCRRLIEFASEFGRPLLYWRP